MRIRGPPISDVTVHAAWNFPATVSGQRGEERWFTAETGRPIGRQACLTLPAAVRIKINVEDAGPLGRIDREGGDAESAHSLLDTIR